MSKKIYKSTDLNIRSDSLCGLTLIETFNNLEINTAGVNKSTINAWFDTDCEATRQMLEWMCIHLCKDNILAPFENYKYEELCQKNDIPSEEQYQIELAQMLQKNPGVLDYEENLLEVDKLEEELKVILDIEQHLEETCVFNGDLEHQLTNKLNKLNKEEICCCVQKNDIQEKCLQVSQELDETHDKLQNQINRYAQQLNKFEYVTQQSFISCIPITTFHQNYKEFMSFLDLFIKDAYDALPNFETTIRSARKQLLRENDHFNETEEFELIGGRISNSITKYVNRKVQEEILKSEMEFLKDFNLSNFLINTKPTDNSFQLSMESNILSQEALLNLLQLDVENYAKKVAAEHIGEPQLVTNQNSIKTKSQQLDNLMKVDSEVTSVMANHYLLYTLLHKESTDIQKTDEFFQNVHFYITTNLYNYQLRVEEMTTVINNYRLYQKLSLEEKLPIIRIKKKLLSDTSEDSNFALDIIKNFNNKYQEVEQRVFFNDYLNHCRYTKKIEQHLNRLQKYLINGPSTQIVILPTKLYETFNLLDEFLNTQAASIRSTLQEVNQAEHKLSKSKWFKIRRQLWMWYLVEPKKVLAAIKQIETVVKQTQSQI
ncbi:hypothetical protein FQA39_LY04683 [Lamprigera yunnana]|nr:hypothetical protein FQA39_LY04683 [Lamprigera yunnana]